MALLLHEIAWGEPILPAVPDPAWEAEIQRRGGRVFEVDRRVTRSPWLREIAFSVVNYRPQSLPMRLFQIGSMVTAQENACRYCYGANRAFMKLMGHSESFIQRVERDVQMAQMDAKERAFIAFCRTLARSRPRPAAAARHTLLTAGFDAAQIHEMAFIISLACCYNRITVLMACPPEDKLERMANGLLGRAMALVVPLAIRFARRPADPAPPGAAQLAAGPFGKVIEPLAGTQGGRIMKAALDGAFDAPVLSRQVKLLMFAVVARCLACAHSEREAVKQLLDEDFSHAEIDAALASLHSPRLAAAEAPLLTWARDTVNYETAAIQHKTRMLGAAIGDRALLEAIGTAALANATVRLAMLQS